MSRSHWIEVTVQETKVSKEVFLLSFSPLTSPTQCTPLCTWEDTTAVTLWPAQMRRRSYYVVGTRSPSWTRWHRLSICLGHAIPNKTPFLPLNIYIRTYIYIKRSATKIDDKKCERKLIEKEVWTLYKMYKMKDYFCMWLQYYILFFWDSFWSKMINIFYERFLIYTLSLTLYPNSHYLCAKWNGNMKNQKKRCYHWSNFNFLFLYELYRKEKKTLFHFTSANCLLFVLTLSGEGRKLSFS